MHNKQKLLSICISSYNRGKKCSSLVESILTVNDERYNIFICDDCSEKDTIAILEKLQNSNVTLVKNDNNVGPCKNWYRTINSGNGKYILHVLDRDDINVKYLTKLLDVLEKTDVGAGYIGKSSMKIITNEKKLICKQGREAFLSMAGVPFHPTGFLINRKQWKKGEYKSFFYNDEKYGIYPHSYVLGKEALEKDLLLMPIKFYQLKYVGDNKKSQFYQSKKNKDYWWLPDSVIKVSLQLINYLYKLTEESIGKEFFYLRIEDGFYRATLGYESALKSCEMKRYGMTTQTVSKEKLLAITLKYMMILLIYAHRINKKSHNIEYMMIFRIALKNIKKIYD